jgi:hypothetical protein
MEVIQKIENLEEMKIEDVKNLSEVDAIFS